MSEKVDITVDSKVVASDSQMSSDLAGEAVILNLANDNYYGLNEVGARVWKLIRERALTAQEICEVLQEDYEVSQEQCQQEVVALLRDMQDHNLIKIAGGS